MARGVIFEGLFYTLKIVMMVQVAQKDKNYSRGSLPFVWSDGTEGNSVNLIIDKV